MVAANELNNFRQDPAWDSPGLNHATPLLQGHPVGFPDSRATYQNGANGLLNSAPAKSRYLDDPNRSLPHLIRVKSTPTDASATAQKRLLNQSGNQTRLFFSHWVPSENEIILSKEPFVASGLCNENLKAPVESFNLEPINEDKLDESYLNDGEGDFREDTEDINALLYSDDGFNEEYDDGINCEDDEVTSTGHCPHSNPGTFHKPEQDFKEHIEEVEESIGSCKRQRLVDGAYKRSSLADTVSSINLARWENYDNDDAQSSCIKGSLPLMGSDEHSSLSTRGKKLSIHKTLRILESLVPGIKSKDPLLFIDEAIDYLKSLKLNCRTLEVDLSQEYPTTPRLDL